MTHLVPMGTGVAPGGVITTADMTAGQAHPQMNPTGPLPEAIFASAPGAGSHLCHLTDVKATLGGRSALSIGYHYPARYRPWFVHALNLGGKEEV